jgi:hypothetical protein
VGIVNTDDTDAHRATTSLRAIAILAFNENEYIFNIAELNLVPLFIDSLTSSAAERCYISLLTLRRLATTEPRLESFWKHSIEILTYMKAIVGATDRSQDRSAAIDLIRHMAGSCKSDEFKIQLISEDIGLLPLLVSILGLDQEESSVQFGVLCILYFCSFIEGDRTHVTSSPERPHNRELLMRPDVGLLPILIAKLSTSLQESDYAFLAIVVAFFSSLASSMPN